MRPELASFFNFIIGLCFAGVLLTAALAIVGVSVYLVIDTIGLATKSPSIQQAWAQLAQQHQLHFRGRFELFGFLGEGSAVTGVYRGHKLHLELIKGKQQDTTVLIMSADPALASSTSQNTQPAVTPDALLWQLAPRTLPHPWRGRLSVNPQRLQITYRQTGKETEVAYLQALFDLVSDLLEGFPRVVTLGGIAVPALVELATSDHPLNDVALAGLHYIQKDTQQQLGEQADRLLCPNCLVRCAKLPVRLSWWWQISYFGCRQCGQSHQFLELNHRPVVAVLDLSETDRIIEKDKQVRISWFVHNKLFDFDEVEIIQADDEAVERFAVQLGNDTDPARRFRYRTMTCRIAPGCLLSVNTLRILGSAFGRVEEQYRIEAKSEG